MMEFSVLCPPPHHWFCKKDKGIRCHQLCSRTLVWKWKFAPTLSIHQGTIWPKANLSFSYVGFHRQEIPGECRKLQPLTGATRIPWNTSQTPSSSVHSPLCHTLCPSPAMTQRPQPHFTVPSPGPLCSLMLPIPLCLACLFLLCSTSFSSCYIQSGRCTLWAQAPTSNYRI